MRLIIFVAIGKVVAAGDILLGFNSHKRKICVLESKGLEVTCWLYLGDGYEV